MVVQGWWWCVSSGNGSGDVVWVEMRRGWFGLKRGVVWVEERRERGGFS